MSVRASEHRSKGGPRRADARTLYIYIYIYIYRERERERYIHTHIHIHIHIYIYIYIYTYTYIYIYIYIHIHIYIYIYSVCVYIYTPVVACGIEKTFLRFSTCARHPCAGAMLNLRCLAPMLADDPRRENKNLIFDLRPWF